MRLAALTAIACGSLASVTAAPEAPSVREVERAPRVEVAFVLDTTGSMTGLIEGAKRRIWSVARLIGDGRPRPDLRVGLVAYRDVGDAYVTQVFDLDADMDAVYERLASLRAEGGGDGPEHVSRALADAVSRLSWSSGLASLRMMFLVGDAPPHLDYQDGFDYRRAVREARQRGILVDAIQCGEWDETTRVFREVALLGGGHYAKIDADGGMPARVTPMDAELARLGAELADTVVAAGTAAEQAREARRRDARAAMPAPAAAEAAGYFAAADRLAPTDLVDLPVVAQKQALSRAGERPRELAGKTEDEAVAELRARKARREAIQARIRDLQQRRDAYLAASAPGRDGFDAQVLTSIRLRARELGIRY